MRDLSASFERSKRERNRGWARAAFVVGIVAASSCSVYDEKLLADAVGTGALPGSGGDGTGVGGATGGDGSGGDSATGATGGSSGGSGGDGSGGDAGDGGSSAGKGGTGGSTAGKGGTGGSAAGKGGTGGSSGSGAGGKGGTTSAGGSAGKGGSGGSTSAGSAGTATAGTGTGGADGCPDDDDKTDPGACGCGEPDTDTDADGTPDCDDDCPMEEARTEPGACGVCTPMAPYTEADCEALSGSLVNRYSFNGTGTTVVDDAGGADGTIRGTGATQSGGVVTLPGGVAPANDTNKAYIELPTGCLDGLTDATFEAWVTWSTTCTPTCTNVTYWQRIFDFGEGTINNTTGSDLFLSPRRTNATGVVYSASTIAGASGETAAGGYRVDGVMINAGMHHFAVVVDDTNDQIRLYVDGAAPAGVTNVNPAAYLGTLASIVDTNCWLGRSNYVSDAYFNGSFDEFRIYDTALSASAITVSYTAGPNAPFL